ncbi:MAG: di-heme oxidoredictase family protein [Alphaproteobacteria bacterium]
MDVMKKIVTSFVTISAILVVSGFSFAEITCLKCHAEENIEQLIAEREIHPDFNQLNVPDWASVKMLADDATNINTYSSSNAYSDPMPNLNDEDTKRHMNGDLLFEQAFVPSPNRDYLAFSGLGPVFNDNSCETCHQKDGRFGLPPMRLGLPKAKLSDSGIFYRISIENENTYNGAGGAVQKTEENLWGSPVAVPNFSDQLFHRAASRSEPVRNIFGRRHDEQGRLDGKGDMGKKEKRGGEAHLKKRGGKQKEQRGGKGGADWHSLQSGQADVWISLEEAKTVTYADGTQITLTKPKLSVDNPYDAPDNGIVFDEIEVSQDAASRLFKPDVKFSPRIGMPIFGLGLLEAISEEDILKNVNSDVRKNNGITGKPNWVYDARKHEICKEQGNCETNPPISLGRFGWKASRPTVEQQTLAALRGDIGVTNSVFKQESIEGTDLWNDYLRRNPEFKAEFESRKKTEAVRTYEELVVFYTQTLAVPARTNTQDADVIKGAQLFEAAQCTACHIPSFTTGTDHELEVFHNKTIYPFSDMLLHDMGEGLADGRRDIDANGREWRTQPLWGIGKTKTVNPMASFLHDGRGKTLEEAILWHGGEAETSKEYFRQLSKEDRDRFIKFLQSL